MTGFDSVLAPYVCYLFGIDFLQLKIPELAEEVLMDKPNSAGMMKYEIDKLI